MSMFMQGAAAYSYVQEVWRWPNPITISTAQMQERAAAARARGSAIIISLCPVYPRPYPSQPHVILCNPVQW